MIEFKSPCSCGSVALDTMIINKPSAKNAKLIFIMKRIEMLVNRKDFISIMTLSNSRREQKLHLESRQLKF